MDIVAHAKQQAAMEAAMRAADGTTDEIIAQFSALLGRPVTRDERIVDLLKEPERTMQDSANPHGHCE